MDTGSETKMDQNSTKEPFEEEENTHRGRPELYSPYELTSIRNLYEEATENHQRAQSRAETRRSDGPPKGLARVTSTFHDFWTHHISIIVPYKLMRDHLALERTFLSYLKTSQAFALLSVIISQLFKLQHRQNPDPVLGYHAVGRPLAVISNCMAIFYMGLGFFRWWRLQQGLVHGKAISGGYELSLLFLGTLGLTLALFVLAIAIAIRRDK